MCDNILTALKGTGKISIVWRNQQLLVCKETTCQLIRKILLFVFTCRKLRIRHDFSKVMRDQITGQAVKFNHGCFESCSTVTTITSCWCCLFHREQTTCKKTLGHTGCVNTSHSWHSRRFHAWWARHSLSCQEAHGESRLEADTNMKSQLLIPWSVITITDYRTWPCLGTHTPTPSMMLPVPFTCHTLRTQQKHLQISDFGIRDLPVT